MDLMITIFSIVLMILAAALVTCVLMQSGKDKSLSSTITGGASESFFSKGKSKTKEKVLSRITTVLAIVFAIATVVLVILVQKQY